MSTALGHRTARQKQAQQRLRELLEQWVLACCAEMPSWRDAVVRIEQAVEGDKVVLRVRIPGVSGGSPTDAAVGNGGRYVVVHRSSDDPDRRSRLVLRDLGSGVPVDGFAMPSSVTCRQIDALQVDGVLEIRMPRGGRRWGTDAGPSSGRI
jgi:HSP20 family molecular chaperone IbpA